MRKLIALVVLIIFNALVGYALAGSNNVAEMFINFVHTGKCDEAQQLADKHMQGDFLFLSLGMISQYCRNDKKKAAEYYKAAVRMNGTDLAVTNAAIRALIEIGETPPEPMNKSASTSSTAPKSQPQQIIIQQQPSPIVMPPLNTCMQDGGSLFCPNHPSTAFKPFKF